MLCTAAQPRLPHLNKRTTTHVSPDAPCGDVHSAALPLVKNVLSVYGRPLASVTTTLLAPQLWQSAVVLSSSLFMALLLAQTGGFQFTRCHKSAALTLGRLRCLCCKQVWWRAQANGVEVKRCRRGFKQHWRMQKLGGVPLFYFKVQLIEAGARLMEIKITRLRPAKVILKQSLSKLSPSYLGLSVAGNKVRSYRSQGRPPLEIQIIQKKKLSSETSSKSFISYSNCPGLVVSFRSAQIIAKVWILIATF